MRRTRELRKRSGCRRRAVDGDVRGARRRHALARYLPPHGGQIQGRDACFTAFERDIAGLKKGDPVIVHGETRYVKKLQPDGTGLTVVYLSRYQKSVLDRPGGLL